ncbi:23S rRNA (guanosine(2251)-2'-O)-methyltransferase RlmB [Haliscomenobacter sp.]|uniref:23S rRNA (guanosine(2251)-2'-O)-methyltransferase RlmB n=1 Tax=Haliscomenobacter sp. TaxID=2717303 RepID=UPI0033650F60
MMPEKQSEIVYGRHPVVDAIKSGWTVDKVVMQQGIRGEFEKEIRHLTKEYEVPLQVVPKERLNKLVGGNHQGVVAFISPIPFQRLEDILPDVFEKGQNPLIVLLDGITDVRNFGAIGRSAEVFGAHALVISSKKSAQVNAEAVKTSAGALTIIPVCREKSMVGAIELLKLSGVKVYVSDLNAKASLSEMDWTIPVALVIGSESEGITSAVAALADNRFIIPQLGQTDSLNASVAAGIILYEATRQRHL